MSVIKQVKIQNPSGIAPLTVDIGAQAQNVTLNDQGIDTLLTDFTGATSSADGATGLVPAPDSADKDKYLKADGTWDEAPVSSVNNQTGDVTIDASALDYDNTISGLDATKIKTAIDEVAEDVASLADVATSGDYDDLANLPTLGTAAAKDYTATITENNHNLVESGAVYTQLASKVDTSKIGAANGIAQLDENGKIPTSQLPAFVGYCQEGYLYNGTFYEDSAHTIPITPNANTVYVDLSNGKTYRWSGTTYIEISPSLALGETSETAYRGDRGATAYNHATDASRLTTAKSSGLYKIGITSEGHVSSVTAATKSDITNLGIPAQDTTYNVVDKTANGLCPQLPNETTTTKFLRQDGTWTAPSVGNGTLTIQQNGTTKGTFTANQSGSTTINITAGEGDTWTAVKTVQSDGETVVFTGLNDNYGYVLYCQNKLVGVLACVKSGSGTNTTLTYTLINAASGDSCKLRILK